jgi:hypothetical protein
MISTLKCRPGVAAAYVGQGTERMKVSPLFPVLLCLCGRCLSAETGEEIQVRGHPGAVRDFAAVSVKEIGPLLVPGRSSSPVVGQAGNYAVGLGGGGSLWFLNNVWTGELKERGEVSLWGIVDGSFAVLAATSPYAAAGNFRYVSDDNKWPLPIFPLDLDYAGVRKFWPRAGVKTAAGYYVFYSLMNNFGPGGGDYFRIGQGLAFAETSGGPYKPLKLRDSYAFWDDLEPSFGSALWPDRDGWLYIYGRYAAEPGKYAAALARVRPEDMAAGDGYQYYSLESATGPWTRDSGEISPVMEDMPEEFSVAYNDHLKAYLAVYFDPKAGEVSARTAPYPWGPWDEPEKILGCGKEEYCFGAKEQRIFSAEGGKTIFFTLEKKNMPYLYEIVLK